MLSQIRKVSLQSFQKDEDIRLFNLYYTDQYKYPYEYSNRNDRPNYRHSCVFILKGPNFQKQKLFNQLNGNDSQKAITQISKYFSEVVLRYNFGNIRKQFLDYLNLYLIREKEDLIDVDDINLENPRLKQSRVKNDINDDIIKRKKEILEDKENYSGVGKNFDYILHISTLVGTEKLLFADVLLFYSPKAKTTKGESFILFQFMSLNRDLSEIRILYPYLKKDTPFYGEYLLAKMKVIADILKVRYIIGIVSTGRLQYFIEKLGMFRQKDYYDSIDEEYIDRINTKTEVLFYSMER